MVFSHPKVQIWVFLTPGPMEATYPVPKMPLTKMGGQGGQKPPQITPRLFMPSPLAIKLISCKQKCLSHNG